MSTSLTRTLRTLAFYGALTGATGCAVEADNPEANEAEGAVAAGAAVNTIVGFYQAVFKVADFIRGKPEDPATVAAREINAKIDAAKTEILAALADARWADRKLKGASVKSEVRTVLDNYKTITSLSPTDPDLIPLRRDMQTKSEDLLNYFLEIVELGTEPQLAYDLAKAYNMLLVTYVSILQIKSEITPSSPAPLSQFSTALSRGFQANYKLIGSRKQACSGSSYIPRRDRMYVGKDLNLVSGDLVGPIESSVYRRGQLFQLFTDRWYTAGEDTCNIKRNECTMPAYYTGGNNGLPQRCDGPQLSAGAAARFKSCLERAANDAASRMNADPVVGFIRESMRGMQSLGGVTVPTTGGAFPGLDAKQGSYFDPVIEQPYAIFHRCDAGRRTYVISP